MRFIEANKINADRFNDNEDGEGITTSPVTIQCEAIRCFYPRKNNRPGTRITFTDGGGFAVAENYDVIAQMIGTTQH